MSLIQCASACVSGRLVRLTLALTASLVTLAPSDGTGEEGEAVAARFTRPFLEPLRLARRSLTTFCAHLVAVILGVPVTSAEAALDARLVLAGRLGGGAKSGIAGQGEESAVVGVALGLLDLQSGLDVGASEVLLATERRREVAVLLAQQRAEHCHERELVVEVKVVDPVVGAD
jgi:hypothetical protein